ncbi:hypothetical protein RN001_011240 [Aquatica leii]|uniref:Acid phosphatase n=1 Tax=Aquatica leii TaxID=1421715 RepID=A0AAN7PVS6_9COLE|nr:hypothetical protein RN001_011240 [Aquatica leii]
MAAARFFLILVLIGCCLSQRNGWHHGRNNNNPQQNNRVLKLVHMIFRHGIRTPADTYPNDPYINNTWFPIGWGQVTNEGKQKLYQHGVFLRNRYDHFLGHYYTPDLYYVQCTEAERTQVTAQCINAGLWPPHRSQQVANLYWQPIPTHAEPLNSDSLLLVRRPCPQYHIELEKVLKSPEVQQKLQRERELFDQVARYTGSKIESFEDAQDVYTTLMSEEAAGVKLPEWTRYFYPHRLYEPSTFSFMLNAYNDQMNRLKGGVLLKKLIEDWKAVETGTIKPKDRRAFLYVGHDSTVVNILSTLKIWDAQIPGFAINALFEFSYDRDLREYGVEIFLRNNTDPFAEPHRLRIPNCDFFCPLRRLISLTKAVIPEDWEEECKTDDEGFTLPPLRGP